LGDKRRLGITDLDGRACDRRKLAEVRFLISTGEKGLDNPRAIRRKRELEGEIRGPPIASSMGVLNVGDHKRDFQNPHRREGQRVQVTKKQPQYLLNFDSYK